LLFGAHAFVWLLPLGLFSLLRVYDVYLLRQTEHQLIAESVVVGESFRDAYLRSLGRTTDDHHPPRGQGASGSSDAHYAPVEAMIDFAQEVLPREHESLIHAQPSGSAAEQAGRSIEPVLRRAQTFNLSALRVLDERGCVVATTRSEAGMCLVHKPEVRAALAGRYSAVLRERVSDEPPPRLGDIRRRGTVRVFIALPIWSDGRVIGVVRASRTGLDALSSLWANRRGLVWFALISVLLVIGVSLAFSAAIARPLSRLTNAARAVARGESPESIATSGSVPREIGVLQQVLFQMADRLSRRADYVQEFASQVGHELKTPITAIRGAAELLAHGLDEMPSADRQRFCGNILEDAQRMERLVNRLLELARLENERPEQAQAIDAVSSVQRLIERHGARVSLEYSGEPGAIAIDPELLTSALGNLVENALRHGGDAPVRVLLSRSDQRLRIDVIDRGPALSEANRKRLFERFFTTERDRGGTGLGLAIVKAIAEARGGRVWATFDAEGTTFSLLL
jgi:signal transduction histidine kinase